MDTEAFFVFHQAYKVTIDESEIDDPMNYHGEIPEEMRTRFHRMFQAIIANEEALRAIFEFEAISEHIFNADEIAKGLMEERYSKEGYDFPDLLITFIHIFAQEDREWLLGLIEEYETPEAKEAGASVGQETWPLDRCFKATVAGRATYAKLR